MSLHKINSKHVKGRQMKKIMMKPIIGMAFLISLGSVSTFAELPGVTFEDAVLVSPSHAINNYYTGATSPAKKALVDMDKRILSLARALRDDPVLIYEHIYNNYTVEPRFGLAKGSLGTLLTKSGTPFDLVSLTVDLFRAAGLEAEYQLGSISLTSTEFGSWFGIVKGLDEAQQTFSVDAQYACQLLANGGIPAKINGASTCTGITGDLQTVEMLHIWTKVKIDGSWKVFDPSMKTHKLYAGIDLSTAMGNGCVLSSGATSNLYNIATNTSQGFQSGYKWVSGLNAGDIADNLRNCSIALESEILTNHANQSIEEIFGGKDLIEVIGGTANQSEHPNGVSQGGIVTWSGEVPDKYRTELTISVRSPSNVNYLSHTIYGDELYGKVMAIHIGDDGKGRYSKETIRLFLDGHIISTSSLISTQSEYGWNNYNITLAIDHPYAAVTTGSATEGKYMDRNIIRKTGKSSASSYRLFNIVYGTGNSSSGLMEPLDEYSGHQYDNGNANNLSFRMEVYKTHGDAVNGISFLNNISNTKNLLEKINTTTTQHHHSLGIATTHYEAFLDIDTAFSISSADASESSEVPTRHVLSAMMSGLEALTLSGPHTYNATSAMPLLAYTSGDVGGWKSPARAIYEIDSSNWESMKKTLTSPAIYEDFIEEYIQQGFKVLTYMKPLYDYSIPIANLPNNPNHYANSDYYFNGITSYLVGGNPPASDEEGGMQPQDLQLGFLAVSPDHNKIAHIVGIRKGFVSGVVNFSSVQKSLLENKDAELNQDHFRSADINLNSGIVDLSVTDIIAGKGSFPYSLPFTRTYSSGNNKRALHQDFGNGNCNGRSYIVAGAGSSLHNCSFAWTHNYKIDGLYHRDISMALGGRRAIDAVDAVVALYGANNILESGNTMGHILSSFQVINWLMEDMTINAVKVNIGPQTILFSESASMINGNHVDVNRITTSMVTDQIFHGPEGSQSSLTLFETENEHVTQMNTGTSTYLERTYVRGEYTTSDGTIFSIPLLANTGSVDGMVVHISTSAGSSTTPQFIRYHLPRKISFSNGIEVAIAVEDDWVEHTFPESGMGNRTYVITNSIGRSLTISDHSVTTDSGHSVSYGFQQSRHPVNGEYYSDLVRFTDHMTNTTDYSYDPDELLQLTTVTDPLNTVVLSLEYDDSGRIKSVTDALLNTISYYISGGSSASVIDTLDNENRTYYNNKGLQVRTVDTLNNITSYEYDSIGRLFKLTFPELDYVEFEYDERHNQVKKTAFSKPDPNNPSAPRDTFFIEAEYGILNYLNPLANYASDINILNWWTDANGNQTNLTYYPNGHIHKVKAPCLNGAATCVDTGRPVTSYMYTSLGQVDSITDPEGMVTKNTYDSIANLASVTADYENLKLKTVFYYDKYGDLCRTVDPRGSGTQTGGYDATCDQ